MVSGGWISQADRARWQRQAAAELAAILEIHRDLPLLAWTVGPAGSVVAGRVNGLAPAAQVRETFEAWRAALAIEEDRHDNPSPASWLHAAARCRGVMVRLTAAVIGDIDRESQ